LRILFTQKLAGTAGSEKHLLELIPNLKHRGVDVAFLQVQHPRDKNRNIDFHQDLLQAQVPVYSCETRFILSPFFLFRLVRLLRSINPQVLHTNLIHMDFIGALIKQFFLPKLKIVCTKHGYRDLYQSKHGLDSSRLRKNLFNFLSSWASKRADTIIFISQGLRTFFEKGGLSRGRSHVTIHYGFNLSGFVGNQTLTNYRFGRHQMLIIGRLVAVKQHLLVINLIPDLLRMVPDAVLVIVGSGPLKDELIRRTTELGVCNSVRFEGFQQNIHNYIGDSDLVLVPSVAEGFGITVLEAWAHAKAVVGFDVPAVNEIIENKMDGVLVKAFNHADFLNSMVDLLLSPERSRRLGENGRAKLMGKFSVSRMTGDTLRVYEGLLNSWRS